MAIHDLLIRIGMVANPANRAALGQLKSELKGIGRMLAAMGGFGAAGIAAGMLQAGMKGLGDRANLITRALADKTTIGVLSRIDYAAKVAGVSESAVDAAAKAVGGGNRLHEIAKRISDVTDKQKQWTMATRYFGDQARELFPLLSQYTANLRGAPTITEGQAARASTAQRGFRKLSADLSFGATTAIGGAYGALTDPTLRAELKAQSDAEWQRTASLSYKDRWIDAYRLLDPSYGGIDQNSQSMQAYNATYGKGGAAKNIMLPVKEDQDKAAERDRRAYTYATLMSGKG